MAVSVNRGTKEHCLKAHQLIAPGDEQAEFICHQGLGHAERVRARSGTELRKSPANPFTEARLIRAYLNLFVAPPAKDGSKITSLIRCGSYEVRLFEFAPESAAETFPLWMELYAHDSQLALDSFGCDDFEAAVGVADEFMRQAKELDEQCLRRPAPARARQVSQDVLTLLRNAGIVCDLIDPEDE
jgi:hypothetical protein